jgi:hypothetical protein
VRSDLRPSPDPAHDVDPAHSVIGRILAAIAPSFRGDVGEANHRDGRPIHLVHQFAVRCLTGAS